MPDLVLSFKSIMERPAVKIDAAAIMRGYDFDIRLINAIKAFPEAARPVAVDIAQVARILDISESNKDFPLSNQDAQLIISKTSPTQFLLTTEDRNDGAGRYEVTVDAKTPLLVRGIKVTGASRLSTTFIGTSTILSVVGMPESQRQELRKLSKCISTFLQVPLL